ncbi:MAG: hypothetical protein ATN35_01815 [Epulopiscium sp. Nele67-Bin004]|nr:MAG: hypothetical protein ATN35_01815 [Epulopiscium sp. Nele67-Bin004]
MIDDTSKVVISSLEIDGYTISGVKDEYLFETMCETQNFYEADKLKAWTPYLPNEGIILDIGSNIGNHSLYWNKYLPNVDKIYAFEPLEVTFNLLSSNIENNNLTKVGIENCCVGRETSFAQPTSVSTKKLNCTQFDYCNDEKTGIQVVTVDDFSKRNNLTNISFMKIDTEGFEYEVLLGAKEVLMIQKPMIWVEISPKTIEDVTNLLDDSGYVVIAISERDIVCIHKSKVTEKIGGGGFGNTNILTGEKSI